MKERRGGTPLPLLGERKEGKMINATILAAAITREVNHPIWSGLFMRVIAGRLTVMDIYAAAEINGDHPDWAGAVAGGNPDFLEEVAEVAFTDFIATLMVEYGEMENAHDLFAVRGIFDGDLIPYEN